MLVGVPDTFEVLWLSEDTFHWIPKYDSKYKCLIFIFYNLCSDRISSVHIWFIFGFSSVYGFVFVLVLLWGLGWFFSKFVLFNLVLLLFLYVFFILVHLCFCLWFFFCFCLIYILVWYGLVGFGFGLVFSFGLAKFWFWFGLGLGVGLGFD